jgi:hypothetical protein
MINSAKNFISNTKKGEADFSIQLGLRVAGSQLNVSFNIPPGEMDIGTSLIGSLQALAGSPIRAKFDKNNNLTGLEFHIGVAEVENIAKLSAIVGANFDADSGDATLTLGGKLSALGIIGLNGPNTDLELGGASKTSLTVNLRMRASTIGKNPTMQ